MFPESKCSQHEAKFSERLHGLEGKIMNDAFLRRVFEKILLSL